MEFKAAQYAVYARSVEENVYFPLNNVSEYIQKQINEVNFCMS
jgi:hypothetical protein